MFILILPIVDDTMDTYNVSIYNDTVTIHVLIKHETPMRFNSGISLANIALKIGGREREKGKSVDRTAD